MRYVLSWSHTIFFGACVAGIILGVTVATGVLTTAAKN